MKNTITLYHDMDTDRIMTFDDISYNYDCMRSEYEEDGDFFPWDSVQEFVDFHVDSGDLEEITAYLSDSKHVYPYYYLEEDIGVQTIMQQYMNWQAMDYKERMSNIPTFAEFLDIPQYDRNGVMSWGFEK